MADDQVVVRAPAKVNLSIRVRPRDGSGRHPLLTLFQSVTLFDVLEVTPDDEDNLSIDGVDLDDGPENLVWKAVEAVRDHAGRDPQLRLHLVKRIPVAAGLGGGSADAAAALEGLRHLLGTKVARTPSTKSRMGLGADVPFARLGGTAIGESYGGRLTRLDPAPGGYALAIVVPPFELSTPAGVFRLGPARRSRGIEDRRQATASVAAHPRAAAKRSLPGGAFHRRRIGRLACRPRGSLGPTGGDDGERAGDVRLLCRPRGGNRRNPGRPTHRPDRSRGETTSSRSRAGRGARRRVRRHCLPTLALPGGVLRPPNWGVV